MANKQTKRERKAEAKQRRMAEQRRVARARKMRKVYTLATVVLIGALVYGGIWLSGQAERSRIAAVNKLVGAAGCSKLQKPAYKGREHIDPPASGTGYSSDPPVSGPHYNAPQPPGPAPTGVHTATLQKEQFVHNLEHGHVGVFYKADLPAEVKAGLESLVNANDEWMLMVPYDGMPSRLALGSWTRLVACQNPANAGAVAALASEFRKQFQGKGFETAPGQPLTPQ